MRASAGCSIVLYTFYFSAYHSFAAFQENHARYLTDQACYIASVDTLTFNATYWTPVLLQKLPFPRIVARSAHVLKSIPYELFPRSSWVAYIDSETILRSDVSQWVASLGRSRPDKEIFVLRHLQIGQSANGLRRGFVGERNWVLRRKQGDCAADVANVNRMADAFCRAGPLCHPGGVIETSLLAWRGRPSVTTVALYRMWRDAISFHSQREQLSFPFIARALGADDTVIAYIPKEEYNV
jgi:hypothetical protein